eukprot:TRINITY_DN1800_c0_g1_i1.p1 TRINITY_DN1800_c0_g1~~TRINITY_DN1800_c0_g1_i1.p1  ORF type:complete len:313 (+),score=58.82 TRINITY_DN1800_c0_g1_i1:75-1013(+)
MILSRLLTPACKRVSVSHLGSWGSGSGVIVETLQGQGSGIIVETLQGQGAEHRVSLGLPRRITCSGAVASSVDEATSASAMQPKEERPLMGSLLDEKKAMRKLVRRELREVPLEQRQTEDRAVQGHILNADWFHRSQRICGYISCAALREVGTELLVENILQGPAPSKVLYVPRVEDQQSHMRMLRIQDLATDLIPNSMQILEPTVSLPTGEAREDLMDAEEPLDLILMPGLAFDRLGGRLGRGGGYYDTFIERYMERVTAKGWKRPLLVALAYAVQVREGAIPMDKSDEAIDALVTWEGVTLLRDAPLLVS